MRPTFGEAEEPRTRWCHNTDHHPYATWSDAQTLYCRQPKPARAKDREGTPGSEITVFDERDGGTFCGFSDPDGNTWAVQQLKVRGEKPLIPHEHRGRFGA